MAEIVFEKEFPKANKTEIEEMLQDLAWLFPLWMQRLHVKFDDKAEEPSAEAFTSVDKTYRYSTLSICPPFLKSERKVQVETLIHELIHVHTSDVKNALGEAIDIICEEDSKLNEVLANNIRSRNESATQDLAFAIMNKFYGEK